MKVSSVLNRLFDVKLISFNSILYLAPYSVINGRESLQSRHSLSRRVAFSFLSLFWHHILSGYLIESKQLACDYEYRFFRFRSKSTFQLNQSKSNSHPCCSKTRICEQCRTNNNGLKTLFHLELALQFVTTQSFLPLWTVYCNRNNTEHNVARPE